MVLGRIWVLEWKRYWQRGYVIYWGLILGVVAFTEIGKLNDMNNDMNTLGMTL